MSQVMLDDGRRVHRPQEQRNVHHPVMERGAVGERRNAKDHHGADRDLRQSLLHGGIVPWPT